MLPTGSRYEDAGCESRSSGSGSGVARWPWPWPATATRSRSSSRRLRPGRSGLGSCSSRRARPRWRRWACSIGSRRRRWPIRAFHAESAPGRTLTLMRYDRRDPASFALGVARGRLFTTLMEAAVAAGVRVVTGARIVDAREDRDAVAPLDELGGEHGSFDVLVGADGMRSALRRRVDPGSRLFLSPHAALWGLGQFDGPCPERLRQQARGVGILAGLLPVGEREMACFWGVRADRRRARSRPRASRRSWSGWTRSSRRRAACSRTSAASIGSRSRDTATRRLARRYTGRIVLIGDAAHPSPPHLGQGANLALLDAVALADALRRERRSVPGLRALGSAAPLAERALRLPEPSPEPLLPVEPRLAGPARDLALPAMGAVPAAPRVHGARAGGARLRRGSARAGEDDRTFGPRCTSAHERARLTQQPRDRVLVEMGESRTPRPEPFAGDHYERVR